LDVLETYLAILKEKGQVDVRISSIVDLIDREEGKKASARDAQWVGYRLKTLGLRKRKSHGTMAIVYDAELLKEALAKREREAAWWREHAEGEGYATGGKSPPEGDETADSPPSVLSTPEVPASVSSDLEPDGRPSQAEPSEPLSFTTTRTAAVLSASPASLDQVCEVCGRPLLEGDVYFGFGGRVLCKEDFGSTAAEEAPTRG
jgi:hypothetical protein